MKKIKNFVRKLDENAFITIHDVRVVFGWGFIDLTKV
ncbi:DUF2179 domain-containing protein [Peribacillus simplex]